MKLKFFALSMACVMAVGLAGCSANRDPGGTDSEQPSSSVSDSGDRASEGVGGSAQGSHGFAGAQSGTGINHGAGDDAAQGGGAGGTDDASRSGSPSGGSGLIDDIGDAAGDLARGAGDAIGDVADGIDRAMR